MSGILLTRSRVTPSRVFIALASLTLLAACNASDDTAPIAPATPAHLILVSGADAKLTVGGNADSLAVIVTSAAGLPIADVRVSWTVALGDGALDVTSSTTDASGIARAVYTTGQHAGEADVAISAGAVSTTLIADQLPGAPAMLIAMSPPDDSIIAGSTWTFPALEVTDIYANPLPGIALLVSESNAIDGDALSDAAVTTDANGMASESFTAGLAPGERVVRFSTGDGQLVLQYTIDVILPVAR